MGREKIETLSAYQEAIKKVYAAEKLGPTSINNLYISINEYEINNQPQPEVDGFDYAYWVVDQRGGGDTEKSLCHEVLIRCLQLSTWPRWQACQAKPPSEKNVEDWRITYDHVNALINEVKSLPLSYSMMLFSAMGLDWVFTSISIEQAKPFIPLVDDLLQFKDVASQSMFDFLYACRWAVGVTETVGRTKNALNFVVDPQRPPPTALDVFVLARAAALPPEQRGAELLAALGHAEQQLGSRKTQQREASISGNETKKAIAEKNKMETREAFIAWKRENPEGIRQTWAHQRAEEISLSKKTIDTYLVGLR